MKYSDKISLLLPTRGRPDNLKRFVRSAFLTADDVGMLEIVVAIDEDDPSYDGLSFPRRVSIQKYPRMVLSEYWNACYHRATGDILGHMGDDIVFRTQGWDTFVRQKFAEYPDHIAFVYGNDGSGPNAHDGRFGTHGFIHRRWAETVGYFVPPYFSSDMNDTWLNDIAKTLGRHKHINILTEHMHPDFGKAELDTTHQERIARGMRDNVMRLYHEKAAERLEDAYKLRKVMR